MRHAQAAGADAALIVAPYYNRPTQEGLLAHFRALADASDLPMVVYNVPARTVTDIGAETMCLLDEIPSGVATQDANSDQAPLTTKRAGTGALAWHVNGQLEIWTPPALLGGARCIRVNDPRTTRRLDAFTATFPPPTQ